MRQQALTDAAAGRIELLLYDIGQLGRLVSQGAQLSRWQKERLRRATATLNAMQNVEEPEYDRVA